MDFEILDENSLPAHPLPLFERWLSIVCESGIKEPNSMSLATFTPEAGPSQRTVLLKSYDEDGFVFYTNYASQKAKEIAENPKVSLLFPWAQFARQVIVKGEAEKISTAESLKYFLTRPRGSQLGAWSSKQSSVISSRSILEAELEKIKEKFGDGEIPLPPFWGGFKVKPAQIEFWQGREHRLHDRFRYLKNDSGDWIVQRHAP